MPKSIYCVECGFLNKEQYHKLIDCNVCNETLSSAGEIKMPKVLLIGLGNFILRKGLSRQDLTTDIEILEDNEKIIQQLIQRIKLKEKTNKPPFNDDGITVFLHQLLKQSITPEKLAIEKDLHRIRVTLAILRSELEMMGVPCVSPSARNLFKLIEERENSNKLRTKGESGLIV